jgi:hypothetical protein
LKKTERENGGNGRKEKKEVREALKPKVGTAQSVIPCVNHCQLLARTPSTRTDMTIYCQWVVAFKVVLTLYGYNKNTCFG